MSKLGRSEFIRRAALGKDINVMEGLPELARQLGKLGGNLNQAVVLLRERRIDTLQIDRLQEEVHRIWQSLSSQTGKIKSVSSPSEHL